MTRNYLLPDAEVLLAESRESLYPTRETYSAEPIDLEHARFLLIRGDHFEHAFYEMAGEARTLQMQKDHDHMTGRWIDDASHAVLVQYLKSHRDDIEAGINDFGDLKAALFLIDCA